MILHTYVLAAKTLPGRPSGWASCYMPSRGGRMYYDMYVYIYIYTYYV